MLGDIDGEAGVTDLEDVAVILLALDGPGVGVLENSRSFFCSRRCFARSARTPFLIGDAKRFPSVEIGDSSTLPFGKCLEQTRLFDVTESSASPKTLSHSALLSGFILGFGKR